MELNYVFPKSEKLTHQKLFDVLFKTGNRAFQYPVLAIWSYADLQHDVRAQIGFSAPKKHFKKAHDRNRIKRWIRESYRTQSGDLKNTLLQKNKQIVIHFITVKNDNISFDLIQPKIKLVLNEITEQVMNAE